MALTAKSRIALARRSIPETDEVREILRDYIARTGLNDTSFAQRVGYSPVTLKFWIRGDYGKLSGNDRMIRARIVDYIDAHPVHSDDDIEGDLHETENFRLLRNDFYLALDRARIVVRHGNPGTQKSFVVRYLIAELNRTDATKNGHRRRAHRVYGRDAMSPSQLMLRIATACGVPSGNSIDRTINNLRHDFSGRRALIVIDEAQHLSESCLETIRELNDEQPYFGLLLLGSHDLKDKFHGFKMEQWRSRLHVLASLPGISRAEGREIVTKELPWLKDSKVESFLNDATVSDRGALVKESKTGSAENMTYISARDLFFNIRQTKEAHERKTRA